MVEAVAVRIWAAILLDRAEAEPKGGEAQLRVIPYAPPIGVAAAYAPSGRVLLGNGAVEAILRHPVMASADIASHRDREACHEDGRRTEVHGHPNARVLVTSERAGGRCCYRRGDGTMAWVRPNTAPISDTRRQLVAGAVGVVDFDELERLTEHQALLMAELSHRVKDALALVQGVASQTPGRATSLGEFRQTFEGRLQARSTAHALLLRIRRQGLSIGQLLNAVLAPYLSDRLQIAAGPDVQLEVRRRAVLALILNELATKAAKYGAFAVPDGRLRVELSEDGQGGLPRLRPRRGESGLADAPRTDHEGFGTKLVRGSTQHDPGGSALRRVGPDTLRWELKMRLA